MGVRLDDLPDFLAKWHVAFAPVDGWETRARRSGDFVDVMAVGVHHTASTTTPIRDLLWLYVNSPDRPIGNGLLDRTGLFHLGAIRATNTQGMGGPYLTHRGVIPKDSGNSRMFSIEAANNGIGEEWTPEQVNAYPRICCAVIDCVNETTPGPNLDAGDVVAHFEWAPGRKFDPAGQSPWAEGRALWNMNDFRGAVWHRLRTGPDDPPPRPPLPPSEDDVTFLVQRPSNGELLAVSEGCRTKFSVTADDAFGPGGLRDCGAVLLVLSEETIDRIPDVKA